MNENVETLIKEIIESLTQTWTRNVLDHVGKRRAKVTFYVNRGKLARKLPEVSIQGEDPDRFGTT